MSGRGKSILAISVVIALIVGLAIGYGVALTTISPTTIVAGEKTVTATLTVTGAATTITSTYKTTVTVGEAIGLRGEVAIGATLPLTGELSFMGEDCKATLELAERQINDWLKARGEQWYVKIYVEDTATSPKTALDKVMALHGRGIKFILGPMSSAEVAEIKSYVDSNEILVISPSSTSPALAIPDDYIFRYVVTDMVQGKAAARILFEQGIRYVVPIWRGDTWGRGLTEFTLKSFKEILSQTGEKGEVAEGIEYDPKAKEFSVEVSRLADIVSTLVSKYGKEKVGVYLVSFPESAAIFAAARGYPVLSEVKWVGSDGTAKQPPFVTEPEIAEFGVKTQFLNPILAPTVTPFMKDIDSYVYQKLGRTPQTYAYAIYDAAWTIALALDLVNAYDAKAIKAILPQLLNNYYGALGNFRLNQDGDIAYGDYIIWVPWRTDGGYEWKVAGTWRGDTDTIEWSDWWIKATGR